MADRDKADILAGALADITRTLERLDALVQKHVPELNSEEWSRVEGPLDEAESAWDQAYETVRMLDPDYR